MRGVAQQAAGFLKQVREEIQGEHAVHHRVEDGLVSPAGVDHALRAVLPALAGFLAADFEISEDMLGPAFSFDKFFKGRDKFRIVLWQIR